MEREYITLGWDGWDGWDGDALHSTTLRRSCEVNTWCESKLEVREGIMDWCRV